MEIMIGLFVLLILFINYMINVTFPNKSTSRIAPGTESMIIHR